MKAVVLEQPGGAEQLVYRDYPDPQPQAAEVIVQLKAAALNHRDIWSRIAPTTRTPAILGSDGAGIIAAVGEGVSNWRVGDEVIINPSLGWPSGDAAPPPGWRILGVPDDGTYAALIKLPADAVFPRPANRSWQECAALPLAGLTAWRALVTRGRLQAGETMLILGTGGVATFLIQIGKALGAKVWITSSSDDKLAQARELGAEVGINYRTSDWVAEVNRLSDGQGVPLVIDSVGQQTWPGAIKAASRGGRIVVFGVTSGPTAEVDIRSVFSKQLSILGTMMGNATEFAAMLDFYTAQRLQPIIHTVLPLSEAATAHRLMEAGELFGKIVLDI